MLLLAGTAMGFEPGHGQVLLRGHTIDPAASTSVLNSAAFESGHHLLLLDGPMTPARRDALTATGVTLAGYLPTNAFIADVSKSTPAQMRALGFVEWAGPYRRDWKIDAALAAGAQGRGFATPARQAMADQGLVAAYVWLFAGEPADPTAASIGNIPNAQVGSIETVAGTACLNVIIPAQDVGKLADMPAVQFAEHMGEFTARGGNFETSWIVQSNVEDDYPLYAAGITGAGQVAGIIDGGISVTHCSFYDTDPIGPLHRKILAYNAEPFNDTHGTHVAGTLAGDATAANDTRGIAYGARLVFAQWPNATEASQYEKHQAHYNLGAAVHNNSWGDDFVTEYNSACRGLDAFQHEHDDNLIVFAITDGNHSVRNPENAKNILAVTASGSAGFHEQVCIGGFGPTSDGRRKPEVAAPGCGITSSVGTACGVTSMTGTSMAAPAVSGAAVLVRQYFMEGLYPSGSRVSANAFTPSGALVKALIVNSAQDMTGPPGYPGVREGWGRPAVANSLGFAPDRRRLLLEDVRNGSPQALSTGLSANTPFYVTCNTPLRVTLAYHDAPALANAPVAAVNNLDLVVTAPDGSVYRGNAFAGGVSASGGSADPINNLEQVLISSPDAGPWTVSVHGTAINEGTQGYALVITGGVDQDACGSSDVDCDGAAGTDDDIEAFFLILGGARPGNSDFNRDGASGLDSDIEAFFMVLGGHAC